ncbi:hypothetical protein ANCDUO_12634 [Ancylostoma duodenale]|uniref:Major sperm protein n=1 Tax=Ancylostoma duodenale TaxID=51022 RepID=A0A0C2CKX3_9BILA|nr:hypothetical protein ANCDUO_12634 [Ancylostoma duodenale]
MKSTRPGVYKMKPVFGVVNPGEKYSIRVTYMGIKVGHRIPLNDRITVVLAAVTSKAGEEDKEAKRSADKEQSRDPKASDNPAEALERLQKSKGIKEPAKGTAKESGKLTPKEDRAKVRGRKSKSKSKQSKKGSKAKDKKVAKTPKKKSKVVTTEVVKPAPKEAAKEPVKPPPKAPPEQVKTPKKVKSPPKEPVKEAPKKPEKEPPKELAKPPPPKEPAKPPEPKKEPQIVKEEVKKEVKVKREEAKDVKKEFEKVEKEKKLSDGTNVTAFTPGGTDPSLGDPLKRQDIVHIGPTGKKQIVIIMYRDVALPEKLLSRSGDEDEEDDDVKSDMPQPPQPK